METKLGLKYRSMVIFKLFITPMSPQPSGHGSELSSKLND